jgi:hypothetical protein
MVLLSVARPVPADTSEFTTTAAVPLKPATLLAEGAPIETRVPNVPPFVLSANPTALVVVENSISASVAPNV